MRSGAVPILARAALGLSLGTSIACGDDESSEGDGSGSGGGSADDGGSADESTAGDDDTGDTGGPETDYCGFMCDVAGYSEVDESVGPEGTVCECIGAGELTEMACQDYCSNIGGDPAMATLDGSTCTCKGVP